MRTKQKKRSHDRLMRDSDGISCHSDDNLLSRFPSNKMQLFDTFNLFYHQMEPSLIDNGFGTFVQVREVECVFLYEKCVIP